jgi:hypothetical protein
MMIEIHQQDGRSVFVAPEAVASVEEAGTSSQWHGIRARVRLHDGTVYETSDTAAKVAQTVNEARG